MLKLHNEIRGSDNMYYKASLTDYNEIVQMKNELITFVEKNEGISEREDGTLDLINNYLEYNGYSVRGGCPEGSYGIDDLNDPVLKEAQDGERYYYCIQNGEIKKCSGQTGENLLQ